MFFLSLTKYIWMFFVFVNFFSGIVFCEVVRQDFIVSLNRKGVFRENKIYYQKFVNPRTKKLYAEARTNLEILKKLYHSHFILTPLQGENKHYRIPRIIHQIWLGSSVPKKYESWMQSWFNWKGWEYKLWTDENVKDLDLYNRELYDASTSFGEKSDILRYEILFQYGGLYVDTDFECFKPEFFEMIHKNLDFYAGIEPLMFGAPEVLRICNALIGSKPGHPLVKQFILGLKNICSEAPGSRDFNSSVVETSGPAYMTRAIYEYVRSEVVEPMVIFPVTYFYPSNPNDDTKFPETAAKHYWEGSWKTFP